MDGWMLSSAQTMCIDCWKYMSTNNNHGKILNMGYMNLSNIGSNLGSLNNLF